MRFILLVAAAFLSAAVAAAEEPTAVAQRMTEQLQAQIRAHRDEYESDHEALYARAAELILPSLDARLAAELALGKQWRRASGSEQSQLQAAMAQALVRIYALALLDRDADRTLDWKRSRMTALDGTTAVSATVSGDALAPVLLLFAMRRGGDDRWKVYDVSFKGSSVIDGLRRRGATLPQLLQAVRRGRD